MNETPVWFDMVENFSIGQKGKKTIHIRTMGNEKTRFTVVLTCTADKESVNLKKNFFNLKNLFKIK